MSALRVLRSASRLATTSALRPGLRLGPLPHSSFVQPQLNWHSSLFLRSGRPFTSQSRPSQNQKNSKDSSSGEEEKASQGGHNIKAEIGSSPIGWRTAASVGLVGVGLLAYLNFDADVRDEAAAVASSSSTGKVTLGGPYELIDQNGEVVKSSDFHGKYVLIYFGFANCPDICPTEMRKMYRALKTVDKELGDPELIQPVFISIDPERDTPKRLTEFAQDYQDRPGTVWLTGTMEQITKVAKAFRVYFSIPELEGPEDIEDGYLVDHSIFFYLMDRQGDFLEFFGRNETAKEVADKMLRRVTEDLTRK